MKTTYGQHAAIGPADKAAQLAEKAERARNAKLRREEEVGPPPEPVRASVLGSCCLARLVCFARLERLDGFELFSNCR